MGILELPKIYGVSRLTILFSELLLLEGASSNQQKLLMQQFRDQMGQQTDHGSMDKSSNPG